MRIELHVIFKGLVQGVGFRRRVHRHAVHNNIVGVVKNLEDGTVEIIAQGTEEALDKLLQDICQHSAPAYIEAMEKNIRPIHKQYQQFQVL